MKFWNLNINPALFFESLQYYQKHTSTTQKTWVYLASFQENSWYLQYAKKSIYDRHTCPVDVSFFGIMKVGVYPEQIYQWLHSAAKFGKSHLHNKAFHWLYCTILPITSISWKYQDSLLGCDPLIYSFQTRLWEQNPFSIAPTEHYVTDLLLSYGRYGHLNISVPSDIYKAKIKGLISVEL